MADYAKPLIDATDGSFEAMQKALNIGMIFWNLAVLKDDAKRKEALAEMAASFEGDTRVEFEEIARTMMERHREMFPDMHVHDSRSVIARVS